jgi:nicotinamidase-related amidase
MDNVQAKVGGILQYFVGKHLRDLGVNTVVVCGCNFPNCPRTTIYEGSERDFRTVLVRDGTSVLYDTGLHELKTIDVSLMSTDECMTWLDLDHMEVEHTTR